MCIVINHLFYMVGVVLIFSSIIVSFINYVIRRHLKIFHNEVYKRIGLDDALYDDTSESTKNYSAFFKNRYHISLNDERLSLLARMRWLFSVIMIFLFLAILVVLCFLPHYECKLSVDDFVSTFNVFYGL